MGSGRFDSFTYASTTNSMRGKTTDQIYTSRSIKKELNPHGVKFRESRDGPDNPISNAIIVALDVTGSMGMLADVIARKGLGILFQRLLDEKPVSDPHIMFMGVGDANYDTAPLQVSQFEADNRIVEQLTGLYLEGGGGGNNSESYHLSWYFAANHTSIDCMEIRGRKGYLFTVGDESVPNALLREQVKQFIGDTPEHDLTAEQLLKAAQEKYHVFHIIIEEGNHAKAHLKDVQHEWKKLMGQNALSLKDHSKLGEGIISIIEMNEQQMGRSHSTASKELPSYVHLLR